MRLSSWGCGHAMAAGWVWMDENDVRSFGEDVFR